MMKKHKKIIQTWRPVHAQAFLDKEDTSGVHEKQCSGCSSTSKAKQGVKATEASSEVTHYPVSSSIVDDIKCEALEMEPRLSAEKHSISIEVGASLIRFIKGKGGSTQKQIEEEMGVKIIFPSSKKEESIIVEGKSVDDVSKASDKILAVVDQVVKSSSLDYSHFVSLPLAIHPQLVDKLIMFKNSILKDCNTHLDSSEDNSKNDDTDKELIKGNSVAVELKVEDDVHVKVDLASIPLVSYAPKASNSSPMSCSGVDESIFIKPKTIHLTVLMLKLWNKELVNTASETLKGIHLEVMDALDNRPVSVRLKGLDSMKGSLKSARVIYAPVEEIDTDGRLTHACQIIIDAFVNAKLVLEKDAKQKLKLHATVMNAKHRKWKGRRRKRRHDCFDAREIMKQFGSEEWGEYPVREAHLSQRFAFDEDGYYHCCASIPFPQVIMPVD